MKKTAIIILSLSLAVLLVCALITLASLSVADSNSSIGIIGGADGPTAILISNTVFSGVIPAILSLCAVTVFCSLCCLVLSKSVKEHCTLKTSGIALSLSACTSLLFYCLLSFVFCFIMTAPYRHPLALPISIIVGIICAVAIVLLLYLYIKDIKARGGKWEIKGLVADIIVFLLYLIPFFLFFDFIKNLIA